MRMARVRKSGSELSATLPMMALMDSASILAWAGSYTPQGRSQWACTSRVGAKNRANIRVLSTEVMTPPGTLLPSGGAARGGMIRGVTKGSTHAAERHAGVRALL